MSGPQLHEMRRTRGGSRMADGAKIVEEQMSVDAQGIGQRPRIDRQGMLVSGQILSTG